MSHRKPYRRYQPHAVSDMQLAPGNTCGDCAHFGRCEQLIGRIAGDEVCDWSPSRFVTARRAPEARAPELFPASRRVGP